jgi:hypothetical protein
MNPNRKLITLDEFTVFQTTQKNTLNQLQLSSYHVNTLNLVYQHFAPFYSCF